MIIFGKKHFDGFYVTVQNLVLEQVLNAETHLNEEFSNFILRQTPAHLAFQK